MEKRTVIDQIEIRRDGTVGVRFLKLLVDDEGNEEMLGYHRTALETGSDVDLTMAAVNAHLGQMKQGLVAADELVKIKEVGAFARQFLPAKTEIKRAASKR